MPSLMPIGALGYLLPTASFKCISCRQCSLIWFTFNANLILAFCNVLVLPILSRFGKLGLALWARLLTLGRVPP